MADEIDCVVIGAGVVGLAIARAIAMAGRETLILEREHLFGSGVSARNSEVIHAGIYYPEGSLKARLCVAGRALLYDYCRDHKIAHRQCGKLIVAVSGEQSAAEAIRQRAARNGVDDLVRLTAAQAQRLEPELNCTAALLSPSTGIVDGHGLMLSLLGDAEAHGAVIAYGAGVTRLEPRGGRIAVTVSGEDAPSLSARLVVNSAGLDAVAVARRIEGFPPHHIPRAWLAKGNYFTLSGKSPFSRLIYPMPEPGGLGTHLTLDLGGQAKFGPDIEWVDRPDYTVDPARLEKFQMAIRRYWPGLKDGRLIPGYAGIRPKIAGPGEPDADFRIDGPETHGVPGIVNLFGIESPGLTASLAIGQEVARLVQP
ncbi:MAG TPA: NAD(P)/FAD-dependent oxidoreductase [Alphaproteobacteria bacterium]|jgi:L-2-hydroxyglutarate oxidase LhgO|nr:NAD(P)/FAD-dependent oxidoreductase [Alphaproteobacteria bacterium]